PLTFVEPLLPLLQLALPRLKPAKSLRALGRRRLRGGQALLALAALLAKPFAPPGQLGLALPHARFEVRGCAVEQLPAPRCLTLGVLQPLLARAALLAKVLTLPGQLGLALLYARFEVRGLAVEQLPVARHFALVVLQLPHALVVVAHAQPQGRELFP